jgi:hypothetical protein
MPATFCFIFRPQLAIMLAGVHQNGFAFARNKTSIEGD